MKERIQAAVLFAVVCYCTYRLWNTEAHDAFASIVLAVIFALAGIVLIGWVLGFRRAAVHLVAVTALVVAAVFATYDQAIQGVRPWAFWMSAPLVVGLLLELWSARRSRKNRPDQANWVASDTPHMPVVGTSPAVSDQPRSSQ